MNRTALRPSGSGSCGGGKAAAGVAAMVVTAAREKRITLIFPPSLTGSAPPAAMVGRKTLTKSEVRRKAVHRYRAGCVSSPLSLGTNSDAGTLAVRPVTTQHTEASGAAKPRPSTALAGSAPRDRRPLTFLKCVYCLVAIVGDPPSERCGRHEPLCASPKRRRCGGEGDRVPETAAASWPPFGYLIEGGLGGGARVAANHAPSPNQTRETRMSTGLP